MFGKARAVEKSAALTFLLLKGERHGTSRYAEVQHAFVKGRLMIVEGANYLVPVAFGATGAITVVTGETVKTQAWAASAEK